MLSKCASPACSTPFRYLHEGKLYLIDRRAASAGRKPRADLRYAGNSRTLEYVWLCSSCCRNLTIQVNDDHGVRVVRRRETQNGSIEAFLKEGCNVELEDMPNSGTDWPLSA
jgi:hypothetical protein